MRRSLGYRSPTGSSCLPLPTALIGKMNALTGEVFQGWGLCVRDNTGVLRWWWGSSDYRPVLYGNGSEIPPLDSSDWFLDPFGGVVTRVGRWRLPRIVGDSAHHERLPVRRSPRSRPWHPPLAV